MTANDSGPPAGSEMGSGQPPMKIPGNRRGLAALALNLALLGCANPHTPRITCGESNSAPKKHTTCAKMDAVAVPNAAGLACDCMLGVAWDGSNCVGLGNCACEGADCDKLTRDVAQCVADHAHCK